MEQKYLKIKKSLGELGYKYNFSNDSLPLVEKLLSDLVQTTDSLRKYMKLAKEAVEERDSLLLGAEPYRCDNAKLVKECNDLHASLIRFREQNEKTQADLRKKLAVLQNEKQYCDSEHSKQKQRINEIELERARKEHKVVRVQDKIGKSVPCRCQSTSALNSSRNQFNKELRISSAMVLADEKIANLGKEVSRLKNEQLHLAEMNESLKNKINTRDKEIQRLTGLLQGGRPVAAVNEECCYRNVEQRLSSLKEEIEYLRKGKRDADSKHKEALNKQHEAMQRALQLAEINKQLEKELKDIDQIALSVEADCNTTVISNSEKINRLQERIHQSIMQIQSLERENAELKREKGQYVLDLDTLRHEKNQIQNVLETVLDEKTRLSERYHHATIIEKDLNIEIDRLMQINSQQKRKLAELGIQINYEAERKHDREEKGVGRDQIDKADESDDMEQIFLAAHKKKVKKLKKLKSRSPSPKLQRRSKSPKRRTVSPKAGRAGAISPKLYNQRKELAKKTRQKNIPNVEPLRLTKFDRISAPQNTPSTRRSERDHSSEKYKHGRHDVRIELNDKESDVEGSDQENLKDMNRTEIDCRFEKLKTERDFYAKEYHNLLEQYKSIPNNLGSNMAKNVDNDRIKELEQQLQNIRFEKDTLFTDKQMLLSRLQTVRDSTEEMDGTSLKSTVKRIERERDLLKADLSRMEDDRNELRQQLKLMVDQHSSENNKLEKLVLDTEEQLRHLEHEKHELLKTQGTKYSSVRGLEDQCDILKDQLKAVQSELIQQKAIYTQLKTLLEQTDRSLSDCQAQLNQAENDLLKAHARIEAQDDEQKALKEEINNLKRDIKSLKGNVSNIDQEKDHLLNNLDDKTEQISSLQQDLKDKNSTISSLEKSVSELHQRIIMTKDDTTSRDYQLKNSTAEINNLKQELEAAVRGKDLALQDNRRLQEDLASCTADVRSARADLDLAKRQVDDLKRQLQHYVAEVKRAEDLISQKEVERSEMLDHYRSLSEEATHLESNNHTLESEATQSRVQLSVALDHATEIERKLEERVEMVRGYERQMAELTGQVANLEGKLRQQNETAGRSDSELTSLRDLCVKLDKQKDSMLKQIDENSDAKHQFEREIERFKRDMDKMRSAVSKEQANVDNLEKLLNDSRQDTVEQRLLNQELQSEVQRLKAKVQELQSKLYYYENTIGNRSNTKHGPLNQNGLIRKFSNQLQEPAIVDLRNVPHDVPRPLAAPTQQITSESPQTVTQSTDLNKPQINRNGNHWKGGASEMFTPASKLKDVAQYDAIYRYEGVFSPVNDRIDPNKSYGREVKNNSTSPDSDIQLALKESKIRIVGSDGEVVVPGEKYVPKPTNYTDVSKDNQHALKIGNAYQITPNALSKYETDPIISNRQTETHTIYSTRPIFNEDVNLYNTNLTDRYNSSNQQIVNRDPERMLPQYGRANHNDPSARTYPEVSNNPSNKPSRSNSILNTYGRGRHDLSVPNYDEASNITLNSLLRVPDAKDISDMRNEGIRSHYGRLHNQSISNTNYVEASNMIDNGDDVSGTNVKDKGGILKNYGTNYGNNYENYGHNFNSSDQNYTEASTVTISSKMKDSEMKESSDVNVRDKGNFRQNSKHDNITLSTPNFDEASNIAMNSKLLHPDKIVDPDKVDMGIDLRSTPSVDYDNAASYAVALNVARFNQPNPESDPATLPSSQYRDNEPTETNTSELILTILKNLERTERAFAKYGNVDPNELAASNFDEASNARLYVGSTDSMDFHNSSTQLENIALPNEDHQYVTDNGLNQDTKSKETNEKHTATVQNQIAKDFSGKEQYTILKESKPKKSTESDSPILVSSQNQTRPRFVPARINQTRKPENVIRNGGIADSTTYPANLSRDACGIKEDIPSNENYFDCYGHYLPPICQNQLKDDNQHTSKCVNKSRSDCINLDLHFGLCPYRINCPNRTLSVNCGCVAEGTNIEIKKSSNNFKF